MVPFKTCFQIGRATVAVWVTADSVAFPSLPIVTSLASFEYPATGWFSTGGTKVKSYDNWPSKNHVWLV